MFYYRAIESDKLVSYSVYPEHCRNTAPAAADVCKIVKVFDSYKLDAKIKYDNVE
jgi:hypothetical protein